MESRIPANFEENLNGRFGRILFNDIL